MTLSNDLNGRALLLEDLQRYAQRWADHDAAVTQRYHRFVRSTPMCAERSHLSGHCTGSAFITCPKGELALLLFHPFLQRWLQPGGHADGSFDLLDVARREAHEETGLPLEALVPFRYEGYGARVPFDLDIHAIPARKQEPEHFHYDLRFLLIADPLAPLVPETPDLQLAWLTLNEISDRTDEESVLRMVRRIQAMPRFDGVLQREGAL